MPDSLRRIYIDSCVFLDYINDVPGHAAVVEAILAEGRRYDTSLFTSILTPVEVAFAAGEQQKRALDPIEEENIEKLWRPGSPVHLVEYYRLIGDDARALIRNAMLKGWSLQAMDALHLRTARRLECTEFFTYEKRLPKFDEITGLTIVEPYTREPLLLPDKP